MENCPEGCNICAPLAEVAQNITQLEEGSSSQDMAGLDIQGRIFLAMGELQCHGCQHPVQDFLLLLVPFDGGTDLLHSCDKGGMLLHFRQGGQQNCGLGF